MLKLLNLRIERAITFSKRHASKQESRFENKAAFV
jgi:hypothetical protein